jgi:hypothetical protein
MVGGRVLRISLPVLILGVLILVAVVALAQRAWRDYQAGQALPEPVRRVIVHTRDDRSFEGVDLHNGTDGMLLAAPKVIPDEGPPVDMMGDLWIPSSNIRAVQIVT